MHLTAKRGPGGSVTQEWVQVAFSDHPLFAALIASKSKVGCCCLVAELCPALCHPMDCSTPGFPVFHSLLEFAQIHVH